jgi:hypothetical protein
VEVALGPRYSDVEEATFFRIISTNWDKAFFEACNDDARPLQAFS